MYTISALGHVDLPDELSTATDAEVEATLRRAAHHLGFEVDEICRVSSVLGGSCIACVDVVAYTAGTALLVARPVV